MLEALLLTQILTILGIIVMRRKYEKEKRTNERLSRIDPLTKLYNRAGFHIVITELIKSFKEETIDSFYLFLVDIDNFKKINDTKSHIVGDACLIEISRRLEQSVRYACSTGARHDCSCSVARLGGDEFAILIRNPGSKENFDWFLDHIFEEIQKPIEIKNEKIIITISMGVSRFPHDGDTPATLLKSADLALQRAKYDGKNRYVYHTEAIDKAFRMYSEYEEMIRYFIASGHFDIKYQPIIDSNTHKTIGAEALFRGNEKCFPNVDFEKLFDIAETSGLMVPFGLLILDRIFEDIPDFVDVDNNFIVSVNISVTQFENISDIKWLLDPMIISDSPPENVAIEITETVFMRNFFENVEKLKELRLNGIQISIDDFGTKYSSLAYLKELPINTLKIDISFIKDLVNNEKSQKITKAIIMMAAALGIKSCAEGVETKEQFQILSDMGCDQIQGFFESDAVSKQELITRLRTKKHS